ncbi:leucine efflux protein LeuE [Pseudescherichia sp.]|uniref:leucine efflux protein LeuE n=1 Tax=Pseudescherichia sp. TaxID=2055881 RepID=UPI0028968994|nr:leucine efflux protein LeuE [Pseudescherichia sp.]
MFHDYGVVNFWTFLAGALVIVMVPGPNSLYVLRTGISRGIRAAYRGVAGVVLGDVFLIFLAWAGIATLIQASPHVFTAIKYLGALFLSWLGIKIIWSALHQPREAGNVPAIRKENYFLKAFMLSITNPKSILFYVSFFIQFIDPSSAHSAAAFSLLGAVLQLISLSWMTFLLLAGAAVARWLGTRRRLVRLGNSLTGLLFIGFAARLAAAQG